ncbi:MAG: hypothetical protein ABI232_05680, partial [Jatrophihabitantaceae bacterium]
RAEEVRMNDHHDMESALRASLHDHALRAPSGEQLAEQIIAEAGHPMRVGSRRRQWRTWTLPLASAAAVAAVAVTVVGINSAHHVVDRPNPVPPAASASTSMPTTPTTAPTQTPTTPALTTNPAGPIVANTVGLHDFRVIDLSFVSQDEGWALGTADCLSGPVRPCAAMVQTIDGGTTWHSMPQPAGANVPLLGCADPCIRGIRFATSKIGYAFGSSALFMTTDGGRSWTRQSGGAVALETLDNNVIRVVTTIAGCEPPGCTYTIRTAGIGSASWHDVPLLATSGGASTGVALSRTGQSAVLAVFANAAGGASSETTGVYVSSNDGRSWTARGEPCPQTGGGAAGNEVDSSALTTAADGSVTVLCTPRAAQNGLAFTSTAPSVMSAFAPGSSEALTRVGAGPISAIGAASAQVVIAADAGGVYRSVDGGSSFSRLAGGASTPIGAQWIGFESATVGRALSESGATIWTTHDAGLTWTRYTFG